MRFLPTRAISSSIPDVDRFDAPRSAMSMSADASIRRAPRAARQLGRTAFVITLVAAALLGSALASIFGRLGWFTPWPYPAREVLGGILTAVLFSGWWWWNLWRRLQRGARSSAFRAYGPSRAWTDAEGIHDHALRTDVTTTYPWALVNRVDETREYAFIWVSKTKALVIPRRIGKDAVAALVSEVDLRRTG